MKFRKFWKIYLITFFIALAVGVGIFCAFFFSGGRTKLSALNGTGFAAVILVCIAGLIFVAREGFFDFAAYGFKQMGAMIFTKNPNQHHDYPEYREQKAIERKTRSNYYVIIIIVSALLFIAYLALRIAFKGTY